MRLLGMVLGLLLASMCLAEVVTVRGTVLGPDDKPVAGAQVLVEFYTSEPERPQAVTSTDELGRFSVAIDILVAYARRYAGVITYVPGLALGGGTFREREFTIRLQPARTVSGQVMDMQGKPVAGVSIRLYHISTIIGNTNSYVSLMQDAPLYERYSTKTDAEGRWALDNMPQNGELSLITDDPRFVHTRFTIKLDPNNKESSIVTVRPGAVIVGKARFANGKPAAGMRVFAQGSDDNYEAWGEATTNADGAYRINSLPTGTVNVMVGDPSEQWVATALERVRVTEGETTQATDLMLTAGAMVEGTVTDEDTGKPIPEVTIVSYGPHRPRSSAAAISAQTDAEGRYHFRVAPGANYFRVAGNVVGYLSSSKGTDITLHSGEKKTLTFRLKKGLMLTGTLVDTDEQPILDATVPLKLTQEERSPDFVSYPEARLDGTGAFTVSGLMPGKWRISAFSNNEQSVWDVFYPQEITLPVDKPIRIILNKFSVQTLRGRVVSPKGEPLSGVAVNLRWTMDTGDAEHYVRKTFISDAEGVFSIEQVRTDAKITLVAAKRDGYSYVSGGAITLVEGQLRMEDIVMEPVTAVQTK